MLYRVSAILLAALVFISTTGVSLHKHFCREELKKVSLLVEPESCHAGGSACESHAAPAITKSCCAVAAKATCRIPAQPTLPAEKDDCCSNTSEFHQVTTDYQVTTEMQLHIPVMAVAILPEVIATFTDLKPATVFRTEKPPPLLPPPFISFRNFRS